MSLSARDNGPFTPERSGGNLSSVRVSPHRSQNTLGAAGCQCNLKDLPNAYCKFSAFICTGSHGTAVPGDLVTVRGIFIFLKWGMHYFFLWDFNPFK